MLHGQVVREREVERGLALPHLVLLGDSRRAAFDRDSRVRLAFRRNVLAVQEGMRWAGVEDQLLFDAGRRLPRQREAQLRVELELAFGTSTVPRPVVADGHMPVDHRVPAFTGEAGRDLTCGVGRLG